MNLYGYVNGNPVNVVDPMGLAIWICNRKAQGLIGWLRGNHAYFCNDRNGKPCGMGGSSGSGRNSSTKDDCSLSRLKSGYCRKVSGSDGQEEKMMQCCQDTANKGIWFPKKNDCHEALDECIKKAGLKNPGAPGGRVGDPCEPCN